MIILEAVVCILRGISDILSTPFILVRVDELLETPLTITVRTVLCLCLFVSVLTSMSRGDTGTGSFTSYTVWNGPDPKHELSNSKEDCHGEKHRTGLGMMNGLHADHHHRLLSNTCYIHPFTPPWHGVRSNLGLSILSADTVMCRPEELGIEPPTLWLVWLDK